VRSTTPTQTEHFAHDMWGLLHSQSRDGVRQWVAEDGLGSVRMMTDVSAVITETRNYAPYGSVLSQSGTSQTVYGFAGEQIDPSGLSYNRARYYNPAMGTFTALDPFEGYLDLPMSLNGYGYVHGNPTNLVDPTGEFPQILLGALAGLALGAIVGGVQGAIMYQMSISGQCGCANQMEAARMGQGAFITQSAAVGAALGTVMGLATTIPGGGLLLAAMNIVDKVEIATKLASVVEDFRDNGQIDNWCPVAELVFDFFTERVTNTLATDAPTRRNPIDMSPDATSPSRINRPTDTTMPKRCSFSADTRIETADGEKSIADIQVGDLIAGYNPHDESVDLFQVTATFAQQHTHTLNITADGETIHTTDEHPFLNADGVWVNAQDLQVGDEVVSADGDVGIVEAIERIDEPQMMYNLSVAVVATYLVGDGKWVVHNVDRPDVPNWGTSFDIALGVTEYVNQFALYFTNPYAYISWDWPYELIRSQGVKIPKPPKKFDPYGNIVNMMDTREVLRNTRMILDRIPAEIPNAQIRFNLQNIQPFSALTNEPSTYVTVVELDHVKNSSNLMEITTFYKGTGTKKNPFTQLTVNQANRELARICDIKV
jgi:RHS repeat-associated protein